MSLASLTGKVRQLRRARFSLWGPFVAGWLKRQRNGFVPCVVEGGGKLVQIPLREFYESYVYFCEAPLGCDEIAYFLGKFGPAEVLYDIGAFRGAYSILTGMKLGKGVEIHTFEPLPRNFEALQKVCRLNGLETFRLNFLAVGESDSLVGKINERDAMLRLGDEQASGEVKFPAVSLDDYVARSGAVPTIIKIDVDGFELQVLRGGQKCLREHHPRLWIEVHPFLLKAQDKSAEEVLQLLREAGYAISYFRDYAEGSETPYHIWCESRSSAG